MSIQPSEDDMKRARKLTAWAGSGLQIFLHKLACEFSIIRSEARAQALEDAALLLERPRIRDWSCASGEASMAVRGLDHPPECSCRRWVDCRKTKGNQVSETGSQTAPRSP